MEQASESIKMSDERHQLCEGAFVGLLRRGILGLQMLPENSSSGEIRLDTIIVMVFMGSVGLHVVAFMTYHDLFCFLVLIIVIPVTFLAPLPHVL